MNVSVPMDPSDTQFLESHDIDMQFSPPYPNITQIHTPMQVECPLLKRPRGYGTVLNPSMPESANRGLACKFFKTHLCKKFNMGTCLYGKKCIFAHGVRDIRYPQSQRRAFEAREGNYDGLFGVDNRTWKEMKLCTRFSNGIECEYGERCLFLHEQPLFRKTAAINVVNTGGGHGIGCLDYNIFANLSSNGIQRHPIPMINKTRLCKKWEATGFCPYGKMCKFSHGQAEVCQHHHI